MKSAFAYFYAHLGSRIYWVAILSIAVGLLDGMGLAMFLPLLQMIGGEQVVSSEGLGNLHYVVDWFSSLGIELTLLMILVLMCVFFVGKGVVIFVQNYFLVVVRQSFVRSLRLQNISGLSGISYSAFVRSDAGQIQNTLSGEMERVSQAFNTYFDAVRNGVLVGVYLLLAFLIDSKFALLVTAGGASTYFIYQRIFSSTKAISREVTALAHRYQGQLSQFIHHFKYLKATATIESYARKLKDSVIHIEQQHRRLGLLSSLVHASREPLIILVVTSVIFLQTRLFATPLGPILISLLLFYRALSYMMQTQASWNRFLGFSGSVDNVVHMGKVLSEGLDRQGTIEIGRFSDEIRLERVCLGYGGRQVLQDVNLALRRGEAMAITGESGSGKTTLVAALTGLLPIQAGRMTVDGIPLEDLNLTTLQSRIGYIPQDPAIFNDTIYNNITFWAADTKVNRARYQKALRQAAILPFVQSLPHQGDTVLGTNGIDISGGQRQRIAIARELYKDIDILIFDEATSALDKSTEKLIHQALQQLKGHYTMIIVSHHAGTLRLADRILKLQDGVLTEERTMPAEVPK